MCLRQYWVFGRGVMSGVFITMLQWWQHFVSAYIHTHTHIIIPMVWVEKLLRELKAGGGVFQFSVQLVRVTYSYVLCFQCTLTS